MLLVGGYYLNIKFGDVAVPISPQMLDELSITLDIDRLLPTFKLGIKDATGILGDIYPYDENLNKISVEISRGDDLSDLNTFKFSVKRRKPDSDKKYQIEGILNVKDLLTSLKCRAFTGNIKSNIESIAVDDLDIQSTEVGASLDYEKTIIQPRWTDAKLFSYLVDNIVGRNEESCYHCFIKNVRGKQTLVFKSLDEMLSAPVKYKLIVGPKPYEDFYPIVEYKIFDNSQLIVDFGAQTQQFGYFDYDNGVYVEDSIGVDECPSLASRTLVNKDNQNDSIFFNFGRNNAFTSNFYGKIKSNFYGRVNNFINMWAMTWGLENISPGDVVKVVFGESLVRGKLFLYQHSGLWLVKRVVHTIGSTYMTNLLLTRNGIETDIDTTLLKASNVIRK